MKEIQAFTASQKTTDETRGECDWNAGVPACNAVASAASNCDDSTRPAPDGRFASVAGETPAFQSHPPTLRSSRIRRLFSSGHEIR